MSDYIKDFATLTGKAMDFYQQPQRIVFPEAKDLEDISRIKEPALTVSFRESMDIYRSLEEQDFKASELTQAAVSLDIAYEEPPVEMRMAVIKILIMSGDYENASLYASEFLAAADLQRLLFEHMPLILDGVCHISHLLLPYWEPEALVAVFMRELRKRKPAEKKGLIWSLVYGQGEWEKMPHPLLEALCTFLYAEMRTDKTREQIQDINHMLQGYEYAEIAEMLALRCYGSLEAVHCQVNQKVRRDEWDERRNEFNRYYSDRIKKGFFIYNPRLRDAVVLHSRFMNAHKLSETETALAANDLHVSLKHNLLLKVSYIKHRGKVRLVAREQEEFGEIKKIADRLRMLVQFETSQEMKSSYWAFINGYEILDTLNNAENYELLDGDLPALLKVFNRYKQIEGHDHKRVLEMISFLLRGDRSGLLGNHYITFFNYYVQFREYEEAERFLERYENELGEKYYQQAVIQLQGRNQKDRKKCGTTVKKSVAQTTQWHPLPFGKGYGSYEMYFLNRGEVLLGKEHLDRMSEQELLEEHERIIGVINEGLENPEELAKYFLMAGAVLNKRQKLYQCNDMSEMLAEDMIEAFYYYSRNERNSLNIDHDMLRSYQEQALYLSSQLHPKYLNNILKNMFEEMLKRYFKDRQGHDDDSLAEAVRHMAQTNTVTDEEFGICIMRLSLYYPDFLLRPEIKRLLADQNEVIRRLNSYVRSLNWGQNSSADMIEILQECRNQLAAEFNNCNFLSRTDSVEEWREKLNKGYRRLGDFKDENRLYGILSEADRKYVQRLMDLLQKLPSEGAIYRILRNYKKKCSNLREDIDKKPSSFAVEHLYEFVMNLEEYSEWRRRTLYEKLEPEFSAEALFGEGNPEGDQCIKVYMQIECRGGMSGIRNISAAVLGSECVAEGESYDICAYVERDGKEYGFLPLRLLSSDLVVDHLYFRAEFEFIIEETSETKSVTLEFHVSMENRTLVENYEQMYNPGSTLYEGNAMAKYTFCGRNSLVQKICRIFYDFPNSMVILYGQRKVGKTTVANYVASSIKKSEEKLLIVNCGNSSISLYNEDIKDCTEKIVLNFYTVILNHLLSELEQDRVRSVCIQEEIKEIREAVERRGNIPGRYVFDSLIRKLQEAFEREECWRGTRILLWFDEFQQYYLSILKGRLQPEFVGFLKAFIEQYGFSFLLVGCEPMIPFVHDIRFGNTFSAAEQIYVEYLTKEYSKDLICTPIPNKSGRQNPFEFVSDEIYRLSAGNPYFIQLICKNLIDDLNEKGKVFADKRMIIDSLHKTKKVVQNNFDSLFSSLNFQAASEEDNNKVLKIIAYRQKERRGSARRKIIEDLENNTEKPAETVLDELISRKVVEEVNGELRIIVRLYEEWIWENRNEIGYDEPLEF